MVNKKIALIGLICFLLCLSSPAVAVDLVSKSMELYVKSLALQNIVEQKLVDLKLEMYAGNYERGLHILDEIIFITDGVSLDAKALAIMCRNEGHYENANKLLKVADDYEKMADMFSKMKKKGEKIFLKKTTRRIPSW